MRNAQKRSTANQEVTCKVTMLPSSPFNPAFSQYFECIKFALLAVKKMGASPLPALKRGLDTDPEKIKAQIVPHSLLALQETNI